MSEQQSSQQPDSRDHGATARPLERDSSDNSDFTRRGFLLWLIRAGYGAFALAFALPALALRTLTRESQAVTTGDVLVYASEDRQGTPVEAESLEPGTAVQAFPQEKINDSDNLVEIVRLAGDPSSIVAYSAICTHLGCSVQPQLNEDGQIICLCHGSVFDPANDAAVVQGPAGRPLPSLPIEIRDDGTIVATGGFTGEVGPD